MNKTQKQCLASMGQTIETLSRPVQEDMRVDLGFAKMYCAIPPPPPPAHPHLMQTVFVHSYIVSFLAL